MQYRYEHGLLCDVVHMDCGITHYEYDNQGFLVKAVDQAKVTYLKNEYDDKGRVVLQTLANGDIYRAEYREAERTVIVFSSVGNKIVTYTYDKAGNRVSEVDRLGRKTVWEYDSCNRVRGSKKMAVYKDFSNYKLNNIKLNNVINIGWLGEAGSFSRGKVSEEFLMNLWEYYKCPVFQTRKIYQNEKLDGYWRFFTAIFNGRERRLGSSEVRVLDKENGLIYASPDLIIHYIMNHSYIPPKEYIKAVIEGPKPNSEDYCNMIQFTYKDVRKIEGQNGICPFCKSKCADFAYKEKKIYSKDSQLIIIESNKVNDNKSDLKDYVYYLICKDCGHLYDFDFSTIIKSSLC